MDAEKDCKYPSKAKFTCEGCGKELKSLLSHLKRTKNTCKDLYDMAALEAEAKKLHNVQMAARKKDLYQNNPNEVAKKRAASKEYYKKNKSKKKELKCKICEKVLSSKKSLESHLEHIHSDKQTSVTCDICDKTIKYKHHIHRHMKQVHGDQKIYECEMVLPNGVKCLSSYKQKEHLKRHQTIGHV